MKYLHISKKLLLLFILFCGETAISFSDKNQLEKILPVDEHIPISHRLNNNLSRYSSMQMFDQEIMEFMEKWDIVGASVAVAQNEKLIYTKGFGYAHLETREKVETKHLFRVASVSKLITAVAIMQLVEEQKINLDDKVFGEEGILNTTPDKEIRDSRVKNITVKQLLNHSSGWSNSRIDLLFNHKEMAGKLNVDLPLTQEQIIEYVLKYKKLSYYPGTKSDYLNFGYVVLGKIIEEVTGTDYESFVISKVLNPVGIYDMHIGSVDTAKRFSNEVSYYTLPRKGKNRLIPTNKHIDYIDLLGAAGGWVASASEIMKLLMAVDGMPGKPDLLSKESIQEMTSHDRNTMPLGWAGSDQYMWWRTGTLRGTSALLIKRNDGISYFMVINTTPRKGAHFPVYINKTIISGLATIDHWPEYDLFDYYEPSNNNSLQLALQ